MANTCGDCLLFSGKGCDGGYTTGQRSSSNSACTSNFKGSAELFSGKKCGGCKFFTGKGCDGGYTTGQRSSSNSACTSSYSPNP
jgi:hypothetical protein